MGLLLFSARPIHAQESPAFEKIRDVSPDGKFGLRISCNSEPEAHASEDLEKIGALGRTEGEPVAFYFQVIPIGEKPAARTIAVGAKLVRKADGSTSYTW